MAADFGNVGANKLDFKLPTRYGPSRVSLKANQKESGLATQKTVESVQGNYKLKVASMALQNKTRNKDWIFRRASNTSSKFGLIIDPWDVSTPTHPHLMPHRSR